MSYDYETASPDRYELLKDFARYNRQKMTESETVLWNALRRIKAGVRFRRQHPIGDYIADFICLPAKISDRSRRWLSSRAPATRIR
jgi:very-short-patch-repair endonuclease